MRKVMFAGPTYSVMKDKSLLERAGFELLAPARRGDIRALFSGDPGVIALVDGRFHQCMAVGHAELRDAVRLGWKVWGLSSMGAIRAFEMRHMGISGFGRVYGHFLGDLDFQDDELALMHVPEPPYTGSTEPLVHLRHALAILAEHGDIDHEHAQRVVDALKSQWYGFRRLDSLIALAGEYGGAKAEMAARTLVADFDQCRVKTLDLADFLVQAPWLANEHVAAAHALPFSRTRLDAPRGA
jgi:hypothetical protein